MENSKFGQMENYVWLPWQPHIYLRILARLRWPSMKTSRTNAECRMPFGVQISAGLRFTLAFGQLAVRTAPEEFVFSISFWLRSHVSICNCMVWAESKFDTRHKRFIFIYISKNEHSHPNHTNDFRILLRDLIPRQQGITNVHPIPVPSTRHVLLYSLFCHVSVPN